MTHLLNWLSRLKQTVSRWIQRRLDFFTTRRTLQLGTALVSTFVIVVVLTARAQAVTGNDVANGAFIVLNTIIFGLVQTIGEIVSLVVQLLVAVSQFNKFSTIRVVDIGWTIVKD